MSAQPARLILVGYRGSGKTCVGQGAADQLGWDFVDTDQQIESTTGRTIREIFESDGEDAFRTLETTAVEQAVRGEQRVISVGGGAVLSEHNRHLLSATGLCVWLTAPPAELHRRLQADPRSPDLRPALTNASELDEIRQLLQTRNPWYAAVADQVVDTSGRSVEQVVAAVVALVQAGTRE